MGRYKFNPLDPPERERRLVSTLARYQLKKVGLQKMFFQMGQLVPLRVGQILGVCVLPCKGSTPLGPSYMAASPLGPLAIDPEFGEVVRGRGAYNRPLHNKASTELFPSPVLSPALLFYLLLLFYLCSLVLSPNVYPVISCIIPC